MDCQHITDNELVERYLNGQLDPAVQDDLEVHILECPECLSRAETLNAIRSDLASRTREIRPAARISGQQLAWMGIAAALVTMCIAGIYLLRSKTSGPAHNASTEPPPSQSAPVPIAPAEHKGTEIQAPVRAETPRRKQPSSARNSMNPASAKGIAAAEGTARSGLSSQQTTSQQAALEQHKSSESALSTFDFARHKNSLLEMSQGTSVEFYALAAVEPPPYISSDTSGTGNPSNSVESSGLASSLQPGGHTLFQDAMAAYREKRYADATKLLESVVTATPEASEPNFYLGICRLIAGYPSEAVEPLKVALSPRGGPLIQASHFYLAKAYLRLDDLAKAEGQMQAAAAMPGRLTGQARSIADRIHVLRNAGATHEGSTQTSPQN
jgi:hypothetical protein